VCADAVIEEDNVFDIIVGVAIKLNVRDNILIKVILDKDFLFITRILIIQFI
jgi:hypothetical protein